MAHTMSVPGLPEPALRLSLPADGIRSGDIVLRLPQVDDVDAIMPAFSDPETREAGNLPDFTREQMLQFLPQLPMLVASGRMLPLIAADEGTGDVLGGATLHHLDAERGVVEIGYWLLPEHGGVESRRGSPACSRSIRSHSVCSGSRRT